MPQQRFEIATFEPLKPSTPPATPAKRESFSVTRVEPAKPAAAEDFIDPKEPFSFGDMLSGWWQNVNPFPIIKRFAELADDERKEAAAAADRGDYAEALRRSLGSHPSLQLGVLATMGKDAAKKQWEQLVKGTQAFKDGRVSEGAGYTLAGLLPLIGPMAADAGEAIGSGEIDRGVGQGLGILTPAIAKAAPKAVKVPGLGGQKLTAPEQASVTFAEQRGIPVDAATATGRPVVATAQKRVTESLGGAGVADEFKGRQADALARVGGELADQTAPAPIDPVMAGEGVRGALTGKIQQLHRDASAAYDQLRALEQGAPTQTRSVQPGAPFQPMKLAVDLRPAQQALRPIYEQLAREKELTGVLQGGKGRALVALDTIIHGDQFAPLSVVDGALSDLKAMARGADMPELRTGGQALAAEAVKQLDQQVITAATNAGPDVLKALQTGRNATKAKYAAAEVLDTLSTEPRKVFDMLTTRKDGAIARLQAVQREAPDQIPNIGRAWLEEALNKATERGQFDHADALYADWQKLGAQTKATIFPAELARSLDHYFLLAKRIAKNPNPSGTAQTLSIFNVGTSVPFWALSHLLYSKAGVKLLTQGLKVPLRNEAAKAAYLGQVNAAISEMGLTPATVSEDQRPMPAGSTRR